MSRELRFQSQNSSRRGEGDRSPRRSARHLGDPAFDQLIRALRRASPEFCTAWKRHEVARDGEGRKDFRHPVVGPLAFEHAVFNPTNDAEQRLVLYSPLPDHDTAAKLRRLLELKTSQQDDSEVDDLQLLPEEGLDPDTRSTDLAESRSALGFSGS